MTSSNQDSFLSRRDALKVGVGLAVSACSEAPAGDGDGPAANAAPGPAPTPTGGPSAASSSPAEAAAPPKLSPAELLAGVEHVVVLMMENRSFDHYLGALASDPAYVSRGVVDGLKGNESNTAAGGTPITVHHLTSPVVTDPALGWDEAHASFNGGKNDGFVAVQTTDVSRHEMMGFHDRTDLPFYYWLADNFTVCDRWFSGVLAPTWPNRFVLHATTAAGRKDNTPLFVNVPETIWDALKARGLSFKNYAAGALAFYTGGFLGKLAQLNPVAPIDEFFAAAKAGTLPSFSLIDPDFSASDDHPSHDLRRGQAFAASIYRALAESPAWDRTLFILTYDESGGFFDHVPPPKVTDADPEFAQLGFRVPTFVVGPRVRKGYVCKTQLEHSSVAATLRTALGIKNLTPRMAAAADVSDCIDPVKLKAPAPPPTGMPVIAMPLREVLHAGVGPSSQPGLQRLVDESLVVAVDARPPHERVAGWVEHAVRLGALHVADR